MRTTFKEETEALTMFSFDDIVAEIDAKKAAAKSEDVQTSWERLREVATELAGVDAAGEAWAAEENNWSIEKVFIENYRGIGNDTALDLNFDPSPGITVFHGLNGAGKSSISDAIEIALTGRTPETSSGTAGKAALWDPVHLAQGAQSARIEVTLASGVKRLHLTSSLDSSGVVQEHRAELTDAGETRQVELGRSWSDALASHQPVFAYASLERRVQLSKDLARFFEGLLALGGSFTALEEAIEERATSSNAAFEQWESSRADAMKSLRAIDDEYRNAEKVKPLNPVDTPKLSDSPDVWINDADLQEEGTLTPTLPRECLAQLRDSASTTKESVTNYERACIDVEQALTGALVHLHSEATARRIDSSQCPVCENQNSNWLSILSATIERNQTVQRLQNQVEIQLNNFDESISTLLERVIEIGETAETDAAILRQSATARRLSTDYREARRSGRPAECMVLRAASELCAWLETKDAQMLIDDAIERSDVARQWRIGRANAVRAFLDIWRQCGPLAVESVGWANVRKRVEALRKSLRERRSATLKSRAGVRVEKLLSDAGLQLTAINLQSTKASMELTDCNGGKVELGMLSAGQRNAVLLAPLLASIDGGPFEFIILDDPVHAFDELRIDQLAEALSEIATTRRVIVLTHDERLKEYLLAKRLECDTRLVRRENNSGQVTVSVSQDFWSELLNDAGHMHDMAFREAGSTNDVTNSLRRLCRLSIDSALRLFVLRNATAFGRDSTSDLQALDKKSTTNGRLDMAESMWAGNENRNPVTCARSIIKEYLIPWNNAVHDNPPTVDFTRTEIKCARDACKALVNGKW